jgi:hypothetical protein
VLADWCIDLVVIDAFEFKVKRDTSGNIEKFKTQLVTKGFKQSEYNVTG